MTPTSFNYNVDLVFVIDSTGSMGHLLGLVKENALRLYQDVINGMREKGKTPNQIRLRIISFRDYLADGEDAMLATRFFSLPNDQEEMALTLKGIEKFGGGDIPEDGLEALGYAIKSNWCRPSESTKCRQVIALWTDAVPHELGFGKSAPNYPRGMAKNFQELTEWWLQTAGMDTDSKRLILYTPAEDYNDGTMTFHNWWTDIRDNWDNVVFVKSKAGDGMSEHNYKQIVDIIVSSIAM